MTTLPKAAAMKDCLFSLLDVPVEATELESAAVTIRKEGRDGLVVGELIADAVGALDGYFALDLATSRVLGARLLLAPVPEPDAPLTDEGLEAVQELFNVLSSTLNTAAPEEHWVMGQSTIEPGAQALDPQLASSRSVQALRISLEGAESGLLATCLGPPVEAPASS